MNNESIYNLESLQISEVLSVHSLKLIPVLHFSKGIYLLSLCQLLLLALT